MQEHIFGHCNSEGRAGVLENVSVTFIDETDLQNLEEKEKTIGSTLSKPWYPGTWIFLKVSKQHFWVTIFSFTRFLGHGMFKDNIFGHI